MTNLLQVAGYVVIATNKNELKQKVNELVPQKWLMDFDKQYKFNPLEEIEVVRKQ